MSDFAYALINHSATILDQELDNSLGFNCSHLFSSLKEESPQKSQIQSIESADEIQSFKVMPDNQQAYFKGYPFQEHQSSTHSHLDSSTHSHLDLHKTKRIFKKGKRKQNSDDDEYEVPKRSNKPKKSSVKGYPTKNLLQNNTKPHFEFLDFHLTPEVVNSVPFVKHLREKSGLNLEEFEKLYRIPQFHDTFEKFFADRYLYRCLMLSRSQLETKKIALRKMAIFEKAFRSQQFNKIN